MKVLTALLSLGLTTTMFANNNNLKEYETVSIHPNETAHEKSWDLHHPGLVRWFENGQEQEGYEIPGCFIVAADKFDDASVAQVQAIAQALTLESHGRTLPLMDVNGSPAFVDKGVESLYVGTYTIKTKDGSSFADLHNKVFEDGKTHFVRISFSRACLKSVLPPFAK